MLPPRRPENDEGYFDYTEGPQSDLQPIAPDTPPGGNPAWFTLLGDSDDVLRMTIRSRGEPFVGRDSTNNAITSQTAEVVWFTNETPDAPVLDVSALHTSGALNGQPRRLKTLYRRVFLVAPTFNPSAASSTDVSVSSASGGSANTLGDLTKRENRFANTSTFPFPTNPALLVPLTGNEIILTNVLAFDVKAFDPIVQVQVTSSGVATLPSDVGYGASGGSPGGTGGFVDLNYNQYLSSAGSSQFSGPGNYPAMSPTYDTWSLHYEQNGIDENGDGVIDSATNGLDDNNNGIVDDPTELEAPPPYPVPLRGVQVKLRVYEPDSRQVREVTVVQDFLPQ
jgi:hypothetical protein